MPGPAARRAPIALARRGLVWRPSGGRSPPGGADAELRRARAW